MSVENLFLMINLGCEMIYVIDQRLRAQSVAANKSAQVLRELTEVLLDHKFLDYISSHFGNKLLTVQQAKSLLNDIACSSLMRLDKTSMDKLWELMVVIYKFQLSLSVSTQSLMDVTFRHLDGIGRLMPELRKSIRIDANKQVLIEVWNQLSDESKDRVYTNVKDWLKPFNTRISVLLKLDVQKPDGTFVENPVNNEFYDHYVECPGSNIYAKTAHLLPKDLEKAAKMTDVTSPSETHVFDELSDQLGINQIPDEEAPPPYNPVMLSVVDFNLPGQDIAGDETGKVLKFESFNNLKDGNEDLGDLV